MAFTLRLQKGVPLTFEELDRNFTAGVGAQISGTLDTTSPNILPFGGGQITVTNGSVVVVGVGTTFTESTDRAGIGYAYVFVFQDSVGDWYYADVDTITDNTNLTTFAYRNLSLNPAALLPGTFTGVSGTYDFFISAYVQIGTAGESVFLGPSVYAPGTDTNVLLGNLVFAAGGYQIAIGRYIESDGAGRSVLIGTELKSNSGYNVALGNGHTIEPANCIAIGRGHTILAPNTKCVVISGQGVQLDAENMTNCIFLGFDNEQIGFANLSNTTIVKHLLQTEISEFASHAAADSAGIPLGMQYTLTGDRTVYIRK